MALYTGLSQGEDAQTLSPSAPGQFVAVQVRGQRSETRVRRAALAAAAGVLVLFVALTLMAQDPQPLSPSAPRTVLIPHRLTHRDEHDEDKVTDEEISNSVPGAGIFTGHSHGEKGGPLSFGHGTYHNVFSNQDEEAACYEGTYGDNPYDCKKCPENKFCPGGLFPYSCPDFSAPKKDAISIEECYCNPGYSGVSKVGCLGCPIGSVCPGKENPAVVRKCPAGSTTKTMYQESLEKDCQCKIGFQPKDPSAPFDCEKCMPGSYCPEIGGGGIKCPEGSNSPEGSTRFTQCICEAGSYMTGPDSAKECASCPEGFFCANNRKHSCGEGYTSFAGSSSSNQCVCKDLGSQYPTKVKDTIPRKENGCMWFEESKETTECDLKNACNVDDDCRGFAFRAGGSGFGGGTCEDGGKIFILEDAKMIDHSRESAKMKAAFAGSSAHLRSFKSVVSLIEALPGSDTRAVIIPEQERGSVTSHLSDAQKKTLESYVKGGGNLVVALTGARRSREIENGIFGFSLSGTGCSTTQKVADTVKSSCFEDTGYSSLPYLNAVYCVKESSLPAGAKAYYKDSKGGVSVFSIPVGAGALTGLSPDWYDTMNNWDDVLVRSTWNHFSPVKVSSDSGGSEGGHPSNITGSGFLFKGLKSACIENKPFGKHKYGASHYPGWTTFVRKEQEEDSLELMSRLKIDVPECDTAGGVEVAFWQHCEEKASCHETGEVFLLEDSRTVDNSRESLKMKNALKKSSFSLKSYADVNAMMRSLGSKPRAIVIPEQERGAVMNHLTSSDIEALKDYVNSGGNLIVALIGAGYSRRLLNEVFGWTVNYQYCGSTIKDDAATKGTCFEGSKYKYLNYENAVSCVRVSSLPPKSKAFWKSSHGSSSVWSAPYGHGIVTGMSPDWYNTNSDYDDALRKAASWGYGKP